tara:strand:+ start:899 stop:1366 length:468 start_codon:yes stop_codon:yes gene_type:complete
MAFSGNALCNSFKKELLEAGHNFKNSGGSAFKLALFDNSAVPSDMGGSGSTMDASVTNYATNNEITGTGYTAKGEALTRVNPSLDSSTAITDFTDLVFSTVTISAVRGAVIFNDDASNDASVCVLDFGGDKAASAGDFTIVFPTANASNAIIRIA